LWDKYYYYLGDLENKYITIARGHNLQGSAGGEGFYSMFYIVGQLSKKVNSAIDIHIFIC